jgi:hypothetical protein
VSNLMEAHATRADGGCTVTVGDFPLRAGCGDLEASGPVKVVARPERIELTSAESGGQRGNSLPGMVERTVYLGTSLQVMVRLATGVQLQVSITNTGNTGEYVQGTPVSVHIPVDALRVLADRRPQPEEEEAAEEATVA